MSLIGWLTASVTDTTMALVEDGALLGPRQLDMGNSGGNVFLGFWNALTYFVKDSDTLWFYIPLLFWGVGVLIHYVQGVALFDEWWELDERTIDIRRQG